MLKDTTRAVYEEMARRGVSCEIVDESRSLLRYKRNGRVYYLRSSVSEQSSAVGVIIADNKQLSSKIVKSLGVKVPDESIFLNLMEAKKFLQQYSEIVVKPIGEAHGNGVTMGVSNDDELQAAIDYAVLASRIHRKILLQKQVTGDDIRVLIIGGKYAAAARRVPAYIVGDGFATIKELIERENKENVDRGGDDTSKLGYISLAVAERFVDDTSLVPDKGERVQVVDVSNMGMGGTTEDVTDLVPQDVREQAAKIAEDLRLPTCGIDFITKNIEDSKGYYFIEINASPGLGIHLHPVKGSAQPVDVLFVDWLLEIT